jgi:hypothetical protein
MQSVQSNDLIATEICIKWYNLKINIFKTHLNFGQNEGRKKYFFNNNP